MVDYNVSNGADANNLSQFSFAGSLFDENNRIITKGISLLTTIESSHSGSSIESVESIKKYASRIYASRNRAVTTADYEALIPSIYAETESVSVYGGEELTPPQYGKVYISIKPNNDRYLSNLTKDNIKNELKKYTVAGIVPEIVDLKYLYVEADSKVYYNSNLVPSPAVASDAVLSNITTYSDSTELNKFGARFKYSKFLTLIDNSHQSITSNITNITIRRDLKASLNTFADYEICYGNRFHIASMSGYNIKSSGFTVSGIGGIVYLTDLPYAEGKSGSINLFRLNSPTQPEIVKRNIGEIDYMKGEIKLYPTNIVSTVVERGTPLIEISTIPYSNDVIGMQDLFLQLDMNNFTILMLQDRISSGANTSGVDYLVSSSYSNGTLIR